MARIAEINGLLAPPRVEPAAAPTQTAFGTVLNQATGVTPSEGPILLQCEGSEVYFRKVELRQIPAP